MLSDVCSDFISDIFVLVKTNLQTEIDDAYAHSDFDDDPPLIERLRPACDAALAGQKTNDIEPLVALVRCAWTDYGHSEDGPVLGFISNIFELIETELKPDIVESYAAAKISTCYPPLIVRLETACEAALDSTSELCPSVTVTENIEPLLALIREAHAVQVELDRTPDAA